MQKIAALRAKLGKKVVILVHHYQRDDVIRFADFRGDSLQLSRVAAGQRDAHYVVFCGVNFMAETAAMLCHPTPVILPAGDAPCPMAGMAHLEQVEEAWEQLTGIWGDDLLPVTYQNSTAEVKAFCGRHGGAVCTSSNAGRVFKWALEQKGHLIFFPDEWLGTNSALAMGIPREQIVVWDPEEPQSSLEQAPKARVVVWKGYCHVHTHFTSEQVHRVRELYPGARVVVHPECRVEVVQEADAAGSTAYIIRYVQESPPGSTIAVGTEINLVARLDAEHPDKKVIPLSRSLCGAMYRTTPVGLRDALRSCLSGELTNVVHVDDETRHQANLALERMLSLSG